MLKNGRRTTFSNPIISVGQVRTFLCWDERHGLGVAWRDGGKEGCARHFGEILPDELAQVERGIGEMPLNAARARLDGRALDIC
jgi:hypothetical protein